MDFPDALRLVLDLEGGKSNNPNDSGGKTNHGVTQATYDAWCDRLKVPRQDVYEIPMDEVSRLYQHDYWLAAGCDKLPGRLAVVHFQASVLMGTGTARKILDAVEWDDAPEDLRVYAYLTLQRERLKSIVANKPKSAVFLVGWFNRVSKTWAFVRVHGAV